MTTERVDHNDNDAMELDRLRAAIQSVKDYIAQQGQQGYHAVSSGEILVRLKAKDRECVTPQL